MDIKDKKTEEVIAFFSALDEISDLICLALKNRTPALNGEKYLTNQDLVRMLHISIRTLQEMRDSGRIPFIQIKGKILYKESDILKLLNDNYFESIH